MRKLLLLLTAGVLLTGTAPESMANSVMASWYDCATPGQCSRSKRTANGEKFNPNSLTAAHKSLKFGTKVKVTHKGRSVIVRINDRGPFVKGRSLDLSRAAARKIGCKGVCKVTMQIVK